MVATFTLLTLALLALWFRGGARAPAQWRYFWVGPFAASLFTGFAAGIVQPLGLLWIAGFGLAAWAYARPAATPGQRAAAAAAVLALAAGLMTHLLPGFRNPRVISFLRLSADAIPYRLHLNYDKTAAGLLLLAFCVPLATRLADWDELLRRMALATAATIALVLALALASGYVRFDPKLPPETWLWLWANLCFTCLAEEALFRGFIQAGLARAWQAHRVGPWLALLVAAVLFGLAHAAGGAAYVALATVAGAGYGWAYLRTGRIEASILTHFALNTLHFLAFTYPALQRAR